MKKNIFPNNSPKLLLTPTDMRAKAVFIVSLMALVYYIIFGGRDSEVASMKATLLKYEELLKETREQILDRLKMCRSKWVSWDPSLPVIYVVTPTYARPVQKAELTRFSHTLMLVSNIHWIIVEDSETKTPLVENFLLRTPLNYTHLNARTPEEFQKKNQESWAKHRGVEQRNTAIRWLRENRNEDDQGVVYFADDDNTYSLQVFDEMRFTQTVSVWPVGLVGGIMVEKPIISNQTGKVIGFNSFWRPDRIFPIDMAGFAVNLGFLLQKENVEFSYKVNVGFQESFFLSQLVSREQLEPKAENCTKVLVWHTRTEHPKLTGEEKMKSKGQPTNRGIEV